MKFDDFNYQVYNPYILVEDKDIVKKKDDDDDGRQGSAEKMSPSKKGVADLGLDGSKSAVLSQKVIEGQNLEPYEFAPISV